MHRSSFLKLVLTLNFPHMMNGRNALHVREWEHAHADCVLRFVHATHCENRRVCHGGGIAYNPTLVVL